MKRIAVLKSLCLIVIISLITIGCKKHREKQNFTLKMTIISKEDGSLLNGNAVLIYKENQLEKYVSAGSFVNGQLHSSVELPRSIQSATLAIDCGSYYSIPGTNLASHYITVSRGINEKTIAVNPVYSFKVTLYNGNCQGNSDSAWFNFLNSPLYVPKLYTGCMNDSPIGLPIWNLDKIAKFQIISKKNGLLDTIDYQQILNAETLNEFTLEY